MEQYINKAALVAEIERRLEFVEKRLKRNNSYTEEGNIAWGRDKALYDAYNSLLHFLDTLEVKEVKEPTASDRGMAEEIIINLKRVEQDYRIDLTREMELVRNKTQKGK